MNVWKRRTVRWFAASISGLALLGCGDDDKDELQQDVSSQGGAGFEQDDCDGKPNVSLEHTGFSCVIEVPNIGTEGCLHLTGSGWTEESAKEVCDLVDANGDACMESGFCTQGKAVAVCVDEYIEDGEVWHWGPESLTEAICTSVIEGERHYTKPEGGWPTDYSTLE